jgi:hypothetical protein
MEHLTPSQQLLVLLLTSNGGVIGGAVWLGKHFARNRKSGEKRDSVIERLVSKVETVSQDVQRFTKELDHERMEIRFLYERVSQLERSFLQLAGGKYNHGPDE